VKIGVLSRFLTAKETRLTLEGVSQGTIDILIGTHRIISKDVLFKDLGLVVIDEEHRFGVRAKEHLKKIKAGVDCLTLSATPIPRTLYMSLVGARDISVINTPPHDRLPIKTIISKREDHVIKNALLRELMRDGQTFFLHNRVESIDQVATQLKKLVPLARILVAHGQMPSREIDTVFHAFRQGEADILVATTIIESGIDIPNANTILIDRADHFGLADLYQIRGRVGRWKRRAYAYLLIPKSGRLSEISRKRLAALVEAGGYGGGMRIAMRDLEIRGAGDILGTEQSGHVSAIGFHLYCKLLQRTIKALQGGLPTVFCDTKIDFPQDARLPEYYVNHSSLRIDLYQRLGETMSWEEVDVIWKEIKDRFGKPPEEVKWLYHHTRIRIFAARHSFLTLRLKGDILQAENNREKGSRSQQLTRPLQKFSPPELEREVIRLLKTGFSIK